MLKALDFLHRCRKRASRLRASVTRKFTTCCTLLQAEEPPPPVESLYVHTPVHAEDGPDPLPPPPPVETLYVYTPLPAHGAFRLLHILPGADDDVICCTIDAHTPTDVDGYPPYKAISYYWGDPTFSAKIFVNSQAHYITKSAEEVLLHMRHPENVQTIWIDAIAIDQQNTAEKEKQIQMMDVIYANALETVVWLGPPEEDDEPALDFILEHRELFSEISENKSTDIEQLLRVHNISPLARIWTDIVELTMKRWFSRVWVVQELALSKCVNVTYGHRSVPWDIFSAAIECCISDHINVVNRVECFRGILQHQQVHRLSAVREKIRRSKEIDMRMALEISGSLNATDPHDFVFALLGLVNQQEKMHVSHFGYDSAVHKLFQTATEVAIEASGDLSVLFRAEPSALPKQDCLPSWVPDFSDIRLLGHMPFGTGVHSLSGVCAGKLSQDTGPPKPSFRGNIASVSGVSVDEITFLSSVWRDDLDQYEYYLHAEGMIKKGLDGSDDPGDGKKEWSRWAKEVISVVMSKYGETDLENSFQNLACALCGSYFENPEVCQDRFFTWEELYLSRRYSPGPGIGEMRHMIRKDWSLRIDNATKEGAIEYASRLESICCGRRFCITACGRFGLVPRTAKLGDKVFILAQSNFPFLLRSVDSLASTVPRLSLVGSCYIHGIMYGEGLESRTFEEVELV